MPITPEELDKRIRLHAWNIRRLEVYEEGKAQKCDWYSTFLRVNCETYTDIEVTWKNFEKKLTEWLAVR